MPNLMRLDIPVERELAISVTDRVKEVTDQLRSLKSNMVQSALSMGELLLEAKDYRYHVIAGHDDSARGWDEWLQASGLDISISQSYYLMKLVTKFVHTLQVPKETLAECNMTSLKEISSFNPDTQGEMMLELVELARNAPNSLTKERVDKIKIDAGEELFSLKSFRLRQNVIKEVVDSAIEKCRLEYGQVIDSESNEIIEISEGRALELICIEYLNSR